MADRPTTFDELADRLVALEARNIVLKDLPLKQLMQKLQQDWDPDGTELVGRGTVTADALDPTVRVQVPAGTRAFYGTVLGNGTLDSGLGFVPSQVATGRYKIVFDTPFLVAPVPLVIPVGDLTNPWEATIDNATIWDTTQVGVAITSGGTLTDRAFGFLVIGSAVTPT